MPIVEGHGDAASIPLLVRKIWYEYLRCDLALDVLPPIRVPRGDFGQAQKLDRPLRLADIKLRATTARFQAILVVVDADDDCIAKVSKSVMQAAADAIANRNVRCVIADPMYEAWFAASHETMVDVLTIAADTNITNADSSQFKKSWVVQRMLAGRRYSETVDQPKLTSRIDPGLARKRSPSFDRLVVIFEQLRDLVNPPDAGKPKQ